MALFLFGHPTWIIIVKQFSHFILSLVSYPLFIVKAIRNALINDANAHIKIDIIKAISFSSDNNINNNIFVI